MKKLNGILGLMIFVMLFSACREDMVIEDITNNPGNPGVSQETSVFGIVYDESEQPLAGVQVIIDEMTALTDDQGVFMVRKAKIETEGTRVRLAMNGYFDAYRTVYPPQPSDKLYVTVAMVPKGEPTKFQASSGGTFTLPNGGGIQFPNNSIVIDYNVSSYDGEVFMYSHYYNPEDEDLGMSAPASLEAIDRNGDEKGLYTYGMYAIELENEFGQKLNLKADSEAEMRFPIPATLKDDAPATIPLWFVDEASGLWNEEGSAELAGNEYVGKVSHFSFWNCDVPFDLIDIQGTLTTGGGTPLANYPVYVRRNNLWGAYGYTNNVGFFSGKVPANELLGLVVRHCGVTLVDQEIGPFSSDADLGNFEVTLTDFATTISGTMKSCMGEPISDGYGIIYNYSIVVPDLNGMFSTVVSGCGNAELTAQFFDGMNLSVSEVLPIDKDAATNALGDIAVCTDLEEYISFSVDGGTYRVIPEPTIAKIDGERIVLKGNTEGFEFSVNISVPLVDIGTATTTQTSIYSRLDGGNSGNGAGYACVADPEFEYEFSCDDFALTITDIDAAENIITGTFAGILASQDSIDGGGGTPTNVEMIGSFRAPITKEFNAASISGQLWVDLNSNGVRGVDEENTIVPLSNVSLTKEGSSFIEFGDRYDNLSDGNYSLEGLEPGTYTVRIFGYPYELTSTDAGSDDVDNDFIVGSNGNQFEKTITLGDGENITNVDCGILPPDEVTCFVSGSGCEPDLKVNLSVGGGMPPFILNLSDGQTKTINNSFASFDITTGGLYTLEVTDALGNMSGCDVAVESYQTSVTGWVWNDLDGGDPDVFDFASDEKLKDVVVNLYKSDGSLYKTTESGQNNFNGYNIRDIEYGDYYIGLEIPTGLEIVNLNDEYNGNNIDPSTGQSEIFTYDECGNGFRMNIGLREQ